MKMRSALLAVLFMSYAALSTEDDPTIPSLPTWPDFPWLNPNVPALPPGSYLEHCSECSTTGMSMIDGSFDINCQCPNEGGALVPRSIRIRPFVPCDDIVYQNYELVCNRNAP